VSRAWPTALLLVSAVAALVWAARAGIEPTSPERPAARARAEIDPAADESESLPTRNARGLELRGVGGADPRPASGHIRGHVVDESGLPVIGARVRATSDPTTAHAPVGTTTDAQGAFNLGPLRSGMHRVEVRTVGAPVLEAVEWLWTGAEPRRLQVAQPIPRIIVHAVDPTGARIPRFLAHVTGANTSEGYGGEAVIGLAFTHDAVAWTSARTLRVWGASDERFRGLDLGSFSAPFDGPREEPVVVVLPTLKAVEVEVVDDGGRPVPGTLVRLATEAGDGWTNPANDVKQLVSYGIADGQGKARVARTEPGVPHRIEVEPPFGFAGSHLAVPSEQVSVRVVVSRWIEVAVRVEGEAGGLDGLPLEVWALEASTARTGSGLPQRVRFDENGEAVVRVAPGRPYRVRIAGVEQAPDCKYAPRTVEAWLPAPTTWKLASARPLDVTVLEEDGSLVDGARVQVFDGAREIASGTLRVATGETRFRVPRPPEGSLRLVVSDAAGAVTREVLVDEAAREGVSVVLSIGEGCDVEIDLGGATSTLLAARAQARVTSYEDGPLPFRVTQLPSESSATTLRWRVAATRWPATASFVCWIQDLGYARVALQRGGRVSARLQPGERIVLRAPRGSWTDREDVDVALHRPDDPSWGVWSAEAEALEDRVTVGGLPPGTWHVTLWTAGTDELSGSFFGLAAQTGVVTDMPPRSELAADEDR
jgi:hypothetical protein